jgi:hypothetical protein
MHDLHRARKQHVCVIAVVCVQDEPVLPKMRPIDYLVTAMEKHIDAVLDANPIVKRRRGGHQIMDSPCVVTT